MPMPGITKHQFRLAHSMCILFSPPHGMHTEGGSNCMVLARTDARA